MSLSLSSFIRRPEARRSRFFLLLWLLTLLAYLPAWKGGFNLDFCAWLDYYQHHTAAQALNMVDMEPRSLYQVTQLQLLALTALFWKNPLAWYLIQTGLFALNGLLLYLFGSRLLLHLKLKGARAAAILGVLLYLLSPNMNEVVIWKACYHYHIALLLILATLLCAQRYLLTPLPKYAWRAAIVFSVAIFTLELFYITPWLVLCLATAYYWSGISSKAVYKKALRLIFLPMLGLFAVHLLLHHALYGVWIPHGAYAASGPASFQEHIIRFIKYTFHIVLLGRFWPDAARQWVYHAAGLPAVYWSALVLLAGLGAFLLLRFRKGSATFRAAAFLIAAYVISIMLILHYMVDELLLSSNDRLLFLPGVWAGMLLAVFIARLHAKRNLFLATSGLVLLAYTALTASIVWKWRKATKLFYNLQYNFHPPQGRRIVLLNLPCNYQGIGLFYSNEPDVFNTHVKLYAPANAAQSKVYDVLSANMVHPWDGAHVMVEDSLHLKVSLNQWGTWWWYNTLGANDYENELYSVHLLPEDARCYRLTLKQPAPDVLFLYQQGDQLRAVDRTLTGKEQW